MSDTFSDAFSESAAFSAVCDQIGADPGTRRCLRRVLLDGVPAKVAAAEMGMRVRQVRRAERRFRQAVRTPVASPEIPAKPPDEEPLVLYALALMESLRGPRGTLRSGLDPETGDRDAIHGTVLCLEDVLAAIAAVRWQTRSWEE